MSRLMVVCDNDGSITDVPVDDARILGEEPRGRPLSRALVPSGIVPLVTLMSDLEDGEVVVDWTLEFRQPGMPHVYYCSIGRAGQTRVIAGARDALEPDEWRAFFEEGPEELSSLLTHMADRIGEKDAHIADLRRQVAVLQEQTKLPNRLENELIRVAAHDLRNPLLVIKMNCSFLLQRERHDMDAVERGMLEDMLDTCEFMGRFLDGMTSLSRVWVGEIDLQREYVDAVQCLEPIVEQSRPVAASRGIVLELTGVDEVELHVDPRKFSRVLHELVGNAIRYCPEGTTVRMGLTRSDDPRHVVIVVEDNGPGIGEAIRASLFRPFGKSPGDGSWGYGAGVGLPIARRIIEAHGGSLRVDSRVGQGTRVEIDLPLG